LFFPVFVHLLFHLSVLFSVVLELVHSIVHVAVAAVIAVAAAAAALVDTIVITNNVDSAVFHDRFLVGDNAPPTTVVDVDSTGCRPNSNGDEE
jgi:hypothetical protein